MSRAIRILLTGCLVAVAALLGAPMSSAAGDHVMIQDYAYSPATLNVQAGTTVTWTNHDEAKHDVAATSGPERFQSPMLAKGQSWSHTFRTAGSYSYYCSVHPDMRAQVAVKAAPSSEPPATSAPATAASTAPSAPAATSSSAAPSVVPQAPVLAAPQQTTPTVTLSLDPMLVIAGLVTAVAVFCLLLLGSRRQE